MNNHWLDCAKKKQLYKEIDEIGMEIWSEDGTLADLIAALNDEQTDFLMSLKIRDFVGDVDEMSFGLEVIAP